MLNTIKTYLKKWTQEKPLKILELLFLSLFILALPSLEAPKNVFLAGFVVVALLNQFQINKKPSWSTWDWIFLLFITSSLLSAIFSGIQNGDEWRGFRTILFITSFGWILSRANYQKNQILLLFLISLCSAFLALIFAWYELNISHTRGLLELHSVGHVNHSAIYLTTIIGASTGMLLSLKSVSLKNFKCTALFILTLLFSISLAYEASRIASAVSILSSAILITALPNNNKIKKYAFLSLITFICCLFLFGSNVIKKTIVTYRDDMKTEHLKNYTEKLLGERTRVWRVSLEAIQFNPFLGIGNKNWSKLTPQMIQSHVEAKGKVFNSEDYFLSKHSHSLYLTAWVERGILGLFAALTMMIFWLKELIGDYKHIKKSRELIYLWSGALSAWMSIFLNGVFNTSFQHENALLALFFLSLYLIAKKN
jgi:O-antigen ligase